MRGGPEEEKEAAQPRPGEAWGATGPRGPSKHRGDLGTCCHFTLQRATSCLPLTPDMSKRKIVLSSLGILTSPARGLDFMRQRRLGHLSSLSKLRQERRSVCFSQCSNRQAQRVPARAHCSGRPRGGGAGPLSREPPGDVAVQHFPHKAAEWQCPCVVQELFTAPPCNSSLMWPPAVQREMQTFLPAAFCERNVQV